VFEAATTTKGKIDMNMLTTLWKDEAGASAAEYALILAIVGAAIATSMVGLRNAIVNKIDVAASNVANAGN
jgi:pilus assembly protein Flp/PilA